MKLLAPLTQVISTPPNMIPHGSIFPHGYIFLCGPGPRLILPRPRGLWTLLGHELQGFFLLLDVVPLQLLVLGLPLLVYPVVVVHVHDEEEEPTGENHGPAHDEEIPVVPIVVYQSP